MSSMPAATKLISKGKIDLCFTPSFNITRDIFTPISQDVSFFSARMSCWSSTLQNLLNTQLSQIHFQKARPNTQLVISTSDSRSTSKYFFTAIRFVTMDYLILDIHFHYACQNAPKVVNKKDSCHLKMARPWRFHCLIMNYWNESL